MADITGTPGIDSLFGSLSADAIVALAGDDIAFGSDGDDAIFGNSGNDALAGNQGNDTINSGRDNDVILSGQGDDISQGDDGNDWVFGNLGLDTLFGNAGDDSIFGGQGNDVIFGGQGNDVIFSDFGNDVIFGDRGTDSLSGGAGNDLFVLTKGGGGATSADADLILDFREGDRLGLAPGLALADINIQFVAGNNGVGDVILRDLSDNTGSYLAIVKNVSSTLITREIFTTDLTPLTDDSSGGGDGGGDGGGSGGGAIEPTPPLARTLNLNIGEDTPISTQFDASDANNDPLTFSIVDAPTNGRASLFGLPYGFFSYAPDANFSGSDSFTYQVDDGTTLSNVATVNINIFSIEDVPVANTKTLGVDLTQPSPIALTGTDGDGDPLSFKILSLPPNGKLFQTTDGNAPGAEITEPNTVVTNAEGLVLFVPNPGAASTASFEYVASDGKADSAAATVTLNLGNVLPNSAPGVDLNGDAVDGLDFTARFRGSEVAIVDSANLNVGDADNNDIASATIRISNLLDLGNEALNIDIILATEKGITVDQTTPGTLTLKGFATVSDYAEVLRTVTYNNTAANPTPNTRTITFVVNDGKDNSVTPVSTVVFPVDRIGDNTANTIVGSANSEDITGARGADTMTGGGGEDVFIYQNEQDGSTRTFTANTTAAINTEIGRNSHDVITDFMRGIDKIGLASSFANVIDFNDILATVQTSIPATDPNDPNKGDIIPGTQRIFAYDDGTSTYLIFERNGNNIDGNDNRILTKLQGVTALGTLTANDFDFIP
jgi:Bacterial Ig domain/RTX calcium-binding nonapeptide repeat (4 copies)